MSITLCARYSDGSENIRRARHAIATRLLTAVGGINRARFLTCITYLLYRHRARYIHDHVIVLFNIIVEQIIFLGSRPALWKIILHMPGLDKRLSFTAENVLGIWLIQKSSAFRQGNIRHREQLLYYRMYLSTLHICFIIRIIFHFCYSYYYRVGQTIFWCLHLHDTSFHMCHDWEWLAPALNRLLAESYRYPNWMYECSTCPGL